MAFNEIDESDKCSISIPLCTSFERMYDSSIPFNKSFKCMFSCSQSNLFKFIYFLAIKALQLNVGVRAAMDGGVFRKKSRGTRLKADMWC